MQIVVAILVFSIIIIIHELGHFLLAKKNGVTVTEFSVGMGPRIFTIVKTAKKFSFKLFASADYCMNREDWNEHTKYSIKILPLGGSCMMLGEDEDVKGDEGAFNNKSVWARMSVILAGPIFNFLLAFVLAMFLIAKVGYDSPEVSAVKEGFFETGEGIQEGDILKQINGNKIKISRELDIYTMVNGMNGDDFTVQVMRDGKIKTITSAYMENDNGNKQLPFSLNYYRVKAKPLQVVEYGAYEVKFWVSTTVKSLGMMAKGQVKKDDISGPVGIVDMIGNTYNESKSAGVMVVILNMFNITILLSANLGVMNLLPIPALDGGRFVFLVIEAIRGKAIDREKEGMIHLIGLVALMILMVLVMFNDVSRIMK